MDPEFLKEMVNHGSVGSIEMTQGFLLGAAVLMEIPMVMILLSRLLGKRTNRIANIIAGTLITLVHSASLFVGESTLHYWFFSVIEIAATVSIVIIAARWTGNPELQAAEVGLKG